MEDKLPWTTKKYLLILFSVSISKAIICTLSMDPSQVWRHEYSMAQKVYQADCPDGGMFVLSGLI